MFRSCLVWLLLSICSCKDADAAEGASIYNYNYVLSEDNPVIYFHSPGFPSFTYSKNINIDYYVQLKMADMVKQLSTRILITFEQFYVEESPFCSKDSFTMRESHRKATTFCGLYNSQRILSMSNSLLFSFVSDSTIETRGYRIRVEIYNNDCSKTFKGVASGSFSSPNYPLNYNGDEICIWKIEVPKEKAVTIRFEKMFDVMGREPVCRDDYVIYSQTGDFNTKEKRFCNHTWPGEFTSTQSSVLIGFYSDCCFHGAGFKASFTIHDEPKIFKAPPLLPPPQNSELCGLADETAESFLGKSSVHLKYPWVVGFVDNNNALFCSGTLLNTLYILVAAHCLEAPHMKRTVFDFRVILGLNNLTSTKEVVLPSKIMIHPQFDSQDMVNDIAIIRLQDAVDYSKVVRPICLLPSQISPLRQDDKVLIAGWGQTSIGSNSPPVFRDVDLTIVSNAHCDDLYDNVIVDSMMCAGASSSKGTCSPFQVENSGPLFRKIGSKWYVVGVQSWGNGCGQMETPAVFSRVSSYQQWIQNVISDAPPFIDVPAPVLPNLRNCGIPNSKAVERIVGGTVADPFEYPWMALIIMDNQKIVGAGALISPNYVLTAASIPLDASKIRIYLGKYDFTKAENYTKEFLVQTVQRHPNFGTPTKYSNDVALLKLAIPAQGLPLMYKPICLPRAYIWYGKNESVVIAGWGKTGTNKTGSRKLMQEELEIVANYDCRTKDPDLVTDQMICAYHQGRYICNGDIGAPLMRLFNGRYYAVGIASGPLEDGCEVAGEPRIFSAIHRHLDWISKITGLAIA